MGIVSIVLSILSIPFMFLTLVSLPMYSVGMISLSTWVIIPVIAPFLALIGLVIGVKTHKRLRNENQPRRASLVGAIFNGISLVYSLLVTIMLLIVVSPYIKEAVVPTPPLSNVVAITQSISRYSEVPSEILEAEFVNYVTNDWFNEYKFYLRITVSPEEIDNWLVDLQEPFNNCIKYSEPDEHFDWWISEETFESKRLYETKHIFDRYNGWICVDREQGYIYVYYFTM